MRRGFRAALMALALVVAATGVAACGDDDTSGSSDGAATSGTTQAAQQPTGEPIKLGQIVAVGGAVDYPDMVAAARAAIRSINADGGINGRPVELIHCNEGNNANTAAACARKLVNEDVVAEVGGQSLTAERQIGAILEAAGVPQIGDNELGIGFGTQDNEFLLYFNSSRLSNAAEAKVCADLGLRKIGIPYIDVPVGVETARAIENAARVAGVEVVAKAPIAANATDFTSPTQTLVGAGAECLTPVLLNSQVIGVLKAAQTLGATPKVVISGGVFGGSDFEAIGDAADSVYVVSPYPPPTETEKFPVFEQFQADMKAEHDAGNADAPYNDPFARANAINSWFAVRALERVMEDGDVEPTREAIMAALKQAENVDLGLPTKWSPNKPGPAQLPRAWSGEVYALVHRDGRLETVTEQPFDALPLAGLD